MPTYAYHCTACGHGFEKFEKMSADASPACPHCGQRAQRLISGGAGLVVKRAAAVPSATPSTCCGGACHQH
jgi:putative FmdB family regulatory protein